MNDYGVCAERAIVPASAVVRRPDSLDAAGDTVVLTAASGSVGLAARRERPT
ncbi:hypothetical protein [Streptomyces vilmorinianum]|uniref:hypothetical protein n=1 Tax=Streptomyces vilmorinianum TaxID=3051092 RepID=UPI00158691FC|nr:hypothetical protein [Streptomyces vilmorinianum]